MKILTAIVFILCSSFCIGQVPAPVGFYGNPIHIAPVSMGTNWALRVVANGGAQPSNSTIAALDTFYDTLVASNIAAKMKSVNCYASDSLTACLTPLIVGSGYDPWRNTNFVDGDLDTNGLAGNGTTKFLDPGFSPPGFSTNSVGLTIYVYTGNNSNQSEIGCWPTASGYDLQLYGGSVYFDSPYASGAGRISHASPNYVGYLSANRIANNDARIYIASSTNTHAQTGTTDVNVVADGRAANNAHFYVFANNQSGPLYFSSKRLSLTAFHDGLNTNESFAFFTAIQTLRTNLGGGFQ